MGVPAYSNGRRAFYKDVSAQGNRAASDTTLSPCITGKLRHTLYIQRIWVNVYTDAAQSITFRPVTTTGQTVFFINTNPGLGVQQIDFGDEGLALPEGENLEMVLSAAGLAFNWRVEAYIRGTSGVQTAAEYAATA